MLEPDENKEYYTRLLSYRECIPWTPDRTTFSKLVSISTGDIGGSRSVTYNKSVRPFLFLLINNTTWSMLCQKLVWNKFEISFSILSSWQ